MSNPPIIENIEEFASPSLMRLPRAERRKQYKIARNFARLSRHYAVLADYVLGMKIEEIAVRHGITARMVSYIASGKGVKHPLPPQRPVGRPRKAA